MDTQAGAQLATKSQTTIDVQAEIIAGQQKEIDRLNILAVENAAEIARLKQAIEWYQGEAGKRMGAVARAELAAPAVPSEQAEPNLKNGFLYQQGLDIKAVLYTDDINGQQVCRDDLWLATTEALNELAKGPAPAPAAPSEQVEPDEAPFLRYWDSVNHDYGFGIEFSTAYRAARASWFAAAAPAAPLPAQLEQSAIYQNAELVLCRLEQMHKEMVPGSWRNMVEEAMPCALAVVRALAGAAPLPELTGQSIADDEEFLGMLHRYGLVIGVTRRDIFAKLVAYIDSRSAASPSPAPTEPQDGLVLPLVAAPVSQRDALFTAAINCGHKITDSAVTLYKNPKMEGNALSQLAGRLAAVPASRMGGITSKESADSDCVSVPVKSLSLAVITLAHASSGNPLYDEAYNELSRVIAAHRTSKESAETAAPGASTEGGL